MKPTSFQPKGRKIAEFPWVGPTAAPAPDRKTGHGDTVGPKALVVVRLVDETCTVNGRVDDTTVYAEGESVAAVRDECFAQLAAIHAVAWREWHWLRFSPDNAFLLDSAFGVSLVRTAETPHGKVWQRWGRTGGRDSREDWLETRLGEPFVGVRGADERDPLAAVLVPVDPKNEAAVAEANRRVVEFRHHFCRYFIDLFAKGAVHAATFVDCHEIIVRDALEYASTAPHPPR